jgi:hypothetical protein
MLGMLRWEVNEGISMDAGNGKSLDFRLQALADRLRRVQSAASLYAAFRPLFRLDRRWSASIASDPSGLYQNSRCTQSRLLKAH